MAAKVIIGQIYDATISKMNVISSTIDVESFMLFSQMTQLQLLHYATLIRFAIDYSQLSKYFPQ